MKNFYFVPTLKLGLLWALVVALPCMQTLRITTISFKLLFVDVTRNAVVVTCICFVFFGCNMDTTGRRLSDTISSTLVDTSQQSQAIAKQNQSSRLKLLNTYSLDTLCLKGYDIEEVITDPVTRTVFRFYNKTHQPKDSLGHYIYGAATFENGLFLPDGKQAPFNNKHYERVLGINNNIVVTVTQQYAHETPMYSELKQYRLQNGGLKLQNRKRIEHAELEFMLIKKNQNILLCGQDMGGGVIFELYSPDFKLLSAYWPFEKGFSQAVYAQTDSTIVIAANPADTTANSIKISVLNAQTGKVIKENETGLNGFGVVQVYPFKEMAVIFGHIYGAKPGSCLVGVNYSGAVLWNKNEKLPLHHRGVGIVLNTVSNGGWYFTSVKPEIKLVSWALICLDLLTGNNLSEIVIKSIYPFDLLPPTYNTDAIRATALLTSGSYTVLLLGQIQKVEDRKSPDNYIYRHNYLCVFDENGNLSYTSDEIQDDVLFNAAILNNQLFITSKTKTYTYELPN